MAALYLFHSVWNGDSVRLIGLGLANLMTEETPAQGELFLVEDDKRARVERAVFALEKKGVGKVTKARLIDRNLRDRDEDRRP